MAAELRLSRLLPCPPGPAWQALTSPDALAAWFWPESLGTTAEVDLRVGGRYRIAGRAAGLAVTGRYVVVERPHQLAFTWRWETEEDETLVTVQLMPSGAGTELVLTHQRFADEASRDDHAKGWSDCLDRLPGWLQADRAGAAGLADEGLASWVADMREPGGPSCRAAGPRRLRQAARQRAGSRPKGPELPLVADLATPAGLRLRLYRPAMQPRPLTLYLHGGGFVQGDLDTADSTCRRLAQLAEAAVLAVDYRLAPEHPGPAAVDDAVSAFAWALRRGPELGADPGSGIGLAGESAGGALALLAAAKLRGRGTPASALLLACPNADMTLSGASIEQEGSGWGLEADDLRWFIEQWIPDSRRRADAGLSPVHAELAGLPPAVIATAGHDPLRDEGGTLAGRLSLAGVDVRHLHHPGLVHGFLGLGHLSPAAAAAGREAFERFGQLLRGAARPPA